MEKHYDVMLHPRSFTKKLTPAETGMVKNQIADYPESMPAVKIAEACTSGRCISFCHAERSGKAFTKADWKYQQVYALDFDNARPDKKKLEKPYYMTCEEAWNHALEAGLKPAFLYTTSSHKEDWHRFRIVFILDEPVTSILEHTKVILALFFATAVNGRIVVDQSCKDASRVFYSGKQILFHDYQAVMSKDELLKMKQETGFQKTQKDSSSSCSDNVNSAKISEAVQQIIDEVEVFKKGGKMSMKSPQTLMNTGFQKKKAFLNHKVYNNDLVVQESKISANPCCITVSEGFYAFCYGINLAKMLNVPLGEKFLCILPDHEDSNPSAEVSMHDGKYYYHCFGCNKHLDIFGLIEQLTGCSHYVVKEWIAWRFNIIYETAWQRLNKEAILTYQDYLVTDDFKTKFPVLQKRLIRSCHSAVLNMILHLARMYVMDEAVTGVDKPIFYMTRRQLYQKSQHFGISKSAATLQKSISFLAHLGLIRVLKNNELPPKLLAYLCRIKKSVNMKYRISCYQIPELTYELLHHAEEILETDKSNCVRRQYFCREELTRAFGSDEAKKCFAQSNGEKLSPVIEIFYKRYKTATEKLLNKKSWTTEQEILNRIKGEYKIDGQPAFMTKADKTKWSSICMPQLLQELNLKRVPFTKQLEEEYEVKPRKKLAYGASKVIVRV